MLTALLAGAALTLKPDYRLAHMFPHATEAYQALVHCDRELGGIHFVQVLVQWPEDADYKEIWRALEATENLLGDEPLIRGPLSVRQFLSLIPGTEFPGKLSLAGLIPQEYRRHFWQPDARRALVAARMQDLGIARYDPAIERVNAGLRGIEGRHPGFQLELSGGLIAASREQQRIVRELAWSLTLAAAIIFVVVLLAYRSLRIGLISTVPNLFPLAATAALLAIWDTSLDIGTASSFVICLGIAVDDTI
ncbi:MAG: MMPL family transporter, partial [Planctomycetota bacterium]